MASNIMAEGSKEPDLAAGRDKEGWSLDKIYPYQLRAAFARTHLESVSALEIDSRPYPYCLTTIVGTLGPTNHSEKIIIKMLEAGCGVIRLNLSHGNQEKQKQLIDNVHFAAAHHELPICLCVDTKGPEIRTGVLKGGLEAEIELTSGSMVTITIDDSVKEACDEHNIWVDYKSILNVIDIGKPISLDNGAITLIVGEKGPYYMKCEVEYGGKLGSEKSVCLPGTDIDLPSVSEKDIQDIVWGRDNGVDAVFASYIKKAEAVRNIRQILGKKGKKIKIFSKIENREGVKKFDEILEASDGIIISRGKLGVEIPYQKVFLAQKMMTGKTLKAGKPVFCSSEMLSSMVKNPKPTRAEVADIANAVMDGVGGLILSNETSSGLWPVLCVATQKKIAKEAECAMYHRQLFDELRLLTPKPTNVTITTAISAVEASIERMASVILVLSINDGTEEAISSYRPRCPIVVVTCDPFKLSPLRLYRGVLPIFYTHPKESSYEKDIDARIQFGLEWSQLRKLIHYYDFVIVVYSSTIRSDKMDLVRVVQFLKNKYSGSDRLISAKKALSSKKEDSSSCFIE